MRAGGTTPEPDPVSHGYNAAGDLLTLTDGRNKVTTWRSEVCRECGWLERRRCIGKLGVRGEHERDLVAVGRLIGMRKSKRRLV